MRRRVDPLGELLRRSGVLDDDAVADVLDHQRQALPFASLCYVLGYADEETLIRALSRQRGIPGAILDRCVVRLSALDGVPRQTYLRHNAVPLFEDDRRLFVAVREPGEMAEVLRELEFVKGKVVIPLIGLQVTLARTLRGCFRAIEQGQAYYAGPATDAAEAGSEGAMVTVSEFEDLSTDRVESEAHQAVLLDVTSEVLVDDLILIDTEDEPPPEALAVGSQPDPINRALDPDDPASVTRPEMVSPHGAESAAVLDLDDGSARDDTSTDTQGEEVARVLIVDNDYDTRHLLVRELHPAGYHAMTARTGTEAVQRIKHDPPDALILDAMLPEIDGFQICRAVKLSRRYRHIRVVLMSAVIDTGPVTDDVLRRHGADGYFEKPVNPDRVRAKLRELLRSRNGSPPERKTDDGFDRALELYRHGRLEEAVETLRTGIAEDPLSAKHHFVLANLLQKKSMIYEAIDEYEATVELKPDYFPALTRLAYLYYKQGFAAKAIETWRRSLPHCPDPGLRENIEVFMRKLIAEMQRDLR